MTTKIPHPECAADETFLGNFTSEDSKTIGWKTKRAGINSYCVDGSPYPKQKNHKVLPFFVKTSEINADKK